MLAIDIMTPEVISAAPDATVAEIGELLLRHHVSGIPILDSSNVLVGIITEGDLLRRHEIGTERGHGKWSEFFTSPDTLAGEYVKSHARHARDLMTINVVAVDEMTPIGKIADIFEDKGIKRVPVLREGKVVGIVSRRNILQALVTHQHPQVTVSVPIKDSSIRSKILAEIKGKAWRPSNVVVRNGMVHIWGEFTSEVERTAMRVAIESVQGVRGIKDHTTFSTPWMPM